MFKAETKKVSLFYGNSQVIRDISMGFPEHTVTALIGPAGSGKSSYLRLFNRMNDEESHAKITGEVLVDGKNIYDRRADVTQARKNAGMIFQKPNPFPKSIFENVAFGLRVNGIKDSNLIEERVIQCLKKVDLWNEVSEKLRKPAFDLEPGKQQLLCLARALAPEPTLILMDEPASLLDPLTTGKLEELIHQLKADYTVIIITHNLQQAKRVSDYTAFFYMGELIEQNETRNIFMSPANEKTQNYITGRFG